MNYICNHAIKSLRKKHSLSQERLAQLSGSTKDYISKIERGIVSNVSIVKLTNLAKALRVHVSELLPPKTEEAA